MPAPVYWFGATSFTNDLASEMVYPLLPALVTRTLGGGALALGVLDGVAESVASAFKLASGYAAEQPRRRGVLVVTGYAIAALVRPLLAIASSAWHVIALRGADRVGKGIRSAPRDVMIAGVVPAASRGRAFGVHRAADHAGAVAGPLVAAGLLASGWAVRDVFLAAVVPGVLATVLAVLAVRGARRQGPEARVSSAQGPRPPAPASSAPDPRPLAPVVVIALAAMIRMPETLLILRAQDLGVSLAAIPLLWAALHVVRSAASYPGGMLADRWGPARTMLAGWLLYAVVAAAFAKAGSSTEAWLYFLMFGLVAALTESPERKLVAELQPDARRGRGFGWYHALIGLAALPGAATLGVVYQNSGATMAFLVSAGATILLVFLMASLTGLNNPRAFT